MNPGPGLLKHYFPLLSARQMEQFEMLDPLYREWNEKINVISRKDIDQLYERHVLHSLGIAKAITLPVGSNIIDVGTGGGFPGIPLAIFFPEVKFHLVDSIGKKIKVVNEITAALQLKNVTSEHGRVEGRGEKYDYSVSRAVAPLAEMVRWLKPLIAKGAEKVSANGMIFLKGGDLKEEISEAGKNVRIFDLKDYFTEEFFLEKKVLYVRNF